MSVVIGIVVTAALVCVWAIVASLRAPWSVQGEYTENELHTRHGGDEFDPPPYSTAHKGKPFAGRNGDGLSS